MKPSQREKQPFKVKGDKKMGKRILLVKLMVIMVMSFTSSLMAYEGEISNLSTTMAAKIAKAGKKRLPWLILPTFRGM